MYNYQDKAPNFAKIVEHICSNSIFQKKAINRYLENAQPQYFAFSEDLVSRISRVIERNDCHEYLAKAYLSYTKSIRLEELYFAKENKYRFSNYEEVYKQVYSRDDYMFDYVIGLCMTQIFWPNHYEIVRYFLDEFLPKVKYALRGAEAGVGHGLFQAELLRRAPKMRSTMLDVSPTSLKMSQKMIAASGIDMGRVEIKQCDVQKEILIKDKSLDVLLIGELIEHLQDADRVLRQFSEKMKDDGLCFFTTAVNAPAEDHILLFRTVDEVRDVLDRNGWKIESEHLGTLNGMSVKESEEKGRNINYTAVISAK